MVRCRGTAMLEFVMCIPLMAILIAAIFFFGWVMRNQQRVCIAARYTSWKYVYDTTPSTQQLNDKFFDDRGHDIYIDLDSDTATNQVRESFINEVTTSDADAGEYAQDLISRNLPGGSYALLRSQFATNSPRWRKWAESGALEPIMLAVLLFSFLTFLVLFLYLLLERTALKGLEEELRELRCAASRAGSGMPGMAGGK